MTDKDVITYFVGSGYLSAIVMIQLVLLIVCVCYLHLQGCMICIIICLLLTQKVKCVHYIVKIFRETHLAAQHKTLNCTLCS